MRCKKFDCESFMNEVLLADIFKVLFKILSSVKRKADFSQNFLGQEDKTFVNFGLDEFDFIELIILLEDHYGIEIQEELFSVNSKLFELVNFIEKKLHEKNKAVFDLVE